MEHQTLDRAGATAAAETMWTIDPNHSTIGFSVKHMMFARVHGRFGSFTGSIRFDGDRPVTARAEIDVASIDTGIRKRDDHLRSADFFDVANYPTISFQTTSVEPVPSHGRQGWLVVGDLTMHGVTRAIELHVEHMAIPAPQGAGGVEFGATATINRSDFGMEFALPIANGGFVVSDEVRIAIGVHVQKS